MVYHETTNGESKSIIKDTDCTSIQNFSKPDTALQSKHIEEPTDSKEVAVRVKKDDCSKGVALRKDIINKSIMRAFTRYYRDLFEFDTVMHTINGWKYDSLKNHIRQAFYSSGLLKLYLEQTTSNYDLGKFKIYCILSDLIVTIFTKVW